MILRQAGENNPAVAKRVTERDLARVDPCRRARPGGSACVAAALELNYSYHYPQHEARGVFGVAVGLGCREAEKELEYAAMCIVPS